MKVDDYISNAEKRYVRMVTEKVSIWQNHNEASNAAIKNIRVRVV